MMAMINSLTTMAVGGCEDGDDQFLHDNGRSSPV